MYAERVTEVLQKMEAGVYGMVELGGVRSLKLPARDRPVGLDLDRLQVSSVCLACVTEGVLSMCD